MKNDLHKNPENPKHVEEAMKKGIEFGDGLGQWEDEFKGKDYITEVVVGGAKSYSFKTASEQKQLNRKEKG